MSSQQKNLNPQQKARDDGSFASLSQQEIRLLKIIAAQVYASNRPRAMHKPVICLSDLAFTPLTEHEKNFCMRVIEKLAKIDRRASQNRDFFFKNVRGKTVFDLAMEVDP
ncbi:MAG: hypothetical protein Q6351_007720 [Candidatus Njordarchaeum guaymaensis]